MGEITGSDKEIGAEKGGKLGGKFLPILLLLLAIGITVLLFAFRARVEDLGNYGYLGAFLISGATNATVIVPIPGILLILPLAATFNPVFIGLASGIGAALGEITGYMFGYSGRGILKNNRTYNRVVAWMKKRGVIVIFIFSLIPFLPFDLAAIAAGALRFPFWKFFLVCWLGRTILYIVIALIGDLGLGEILPAL